MTPRRLHPHQLADPDRRPACRGPGDGPVDDPRAEATARTATGAGEANHEAT